MANTSTNEYLVWQLGEHCFALDLIECREIIPEMAVTQVPHAEDSVAGIANIRGAVLAVYDLPVLLGYESKKSAAKARMIIRVKQYQRDFGIAADCVFDVVPVADDKVRDLPGNFSELEARYVRAIAVLPEKIALVIHAGAIETE